MKFPSLSYGFKFQQVICCSQNQIIARPYMRGISWVIDNLCTYHSLICQFHKAQQNQDSGSEKTNTLKGAGRKGHLSDRKGEN